MSQEIIENGVKYVQKTNLSRNYFDLAAILE